MTWILHKGNRKQMYNTDMSESIHVGQVNETGGWAVIVWFNNLKVYLEYPSEQEARQAFGYLIESIKRGDNLAHI